MARKVYVGYEPGQESGVAKAVKEIYVGVNGVARRVKKGYIGINGIARNTWGNVPWKKYSCNSRSEWYENEFTPFIHDFSNGAFKYTTFYTGYYFSTSDGYVLTGPTKITTATEMIGKYQGHSSQISKIVELTYYDDETGRAEGKLQYLTSADFRTYYSKGSTDYGIVEAPVDSLPEVGTLVQGSIEGDWCIVRVNNTTYYYEKYVAPTIPDGVVWNRYYASSTWVDGYYNQYDYPIGQRYTNGDYYGNPVTIPLYDGYTFSRSSGFSGTTTSLNGSYKVNSTRVDKAVEYSVDSEKSKDDDIYVNVTYECVAAALYYGGYYDYDRGSYVDYVVVPEGELPTTGEILSQGTNTIVVRENGKLYFYEKVT